MVRTKPQRQKGDDAFEKRKQKVGRKKLAPATATRAEVHARTLRLATSSALAHAPKTQEESARHGLETAHHSFAELLTMSRHYKATSRASAFAAMAKALQRQEQMDLEEMRAGDRYAGFLSTGPSAAAAAEKAKTSSTTGAATSLPLARGGVTPLEKLKAYAAALEAITDTDVDARQAALSCLAVILRHQWISPTSWTPAAVTATGRGGAVGNGNATPSLGFSKGRWNSGVAPAALVPGMAGTPLDTAEAIWKARHGSPNDHRRAGSPLATSPAFAVDDISAEVLLGLTLHDDHVNNSSNGGGDGRDGLSASVAAPDMAEQERVKAAMQAVHIAFTHAMKGVRLAGVELLRLVLANARPGAVMIAARAVCRQQRAYLPADDDGNEDNAAAAGAADGKSKPGSRTCNRDSARADAVTSPSPTADPQERHRIHTCAEEAWVVRLVKRLSQLVLRTREVHVLPQLLAAVLGPTMCHMDQHVHSNSNGDCSVLCRGEDGGVGGESDPLQDDSLWHTPELIADFFDDVLPQWSNEWKELMELQLALLRQEEKLAMAVSLGQGFAIVLGYLKRAQMSRTAEERRVWLRQQTIEASRAARHLSESSDSKTPARAERENPAVAKASEPPRGARLLSRAKQQRIKDLFIHRAPVTMEGMLSQKTGRSSGFGGRGSGIAYSPASSTTANRGDLALVLAQVCSPLAGTEEGWAVLDRFFTAVFVGRERTTAANEEGGGASGSRPQPPQHSPLSLLRSVQLYLSVMRLFPKRVNTDTLSVRGTHTSHDRSAGGGIWLSAAAGGNSTDGNSGSGVCEQLIAFAPRILQAVITLTTDVQQQRRQLSTLMNGGPESEFEHASLSVANAKARDAATVAELLLATSDIVDTLAHYPISTPTSARPTREATLTSQALHDVFSRVPRLLFSLRPQAPVMATVSAKRRREEGKEEGDSGDEASGIAPAKKEMETAPARTEWIDATLLVDRPALVDMIVHRCLQALWFMASSGHPLLTPTASSTAKASRKCGADNTTATAAAGSLRDALRGGLQSLFGLTLPGSVTGATPTVMDGVLARCTLPTVALAQETLFYLGVREATKMRIVRPLRDKQHEERNEQTSSSAVAIGLEDVLLMLA